MDATPSSLQSTTSIEPTQTTSPMAATDDSNGTAEIPPKSKPTTVLIDKKKKKKKKPITDISDPAQVSSSSTSSCCTSSYSHSVPRSIRVSNSRRNPRVLIGSARQNENDVEALALPLGMSIAAVVDQRQSEEFILGSVLCG
ncbi:unnamed protein product [Ilex paraguariensis]|uniref:Uncharacterized protein n=1 Tax=Ilex paraguariensis TaxID=185542 RepID=A0ABC8U4R5_9AQUA